MWIPSRVQTARPGIRSRDWPLKNRPSATVTGWPNRKGSKCLKNTRRAADLKSPQHKTKMKWLIGRGISQKLLRGSPRELWCGCWHGQRSHRGILAMGKRHLSSPFLPSSSLKYLPPKGFFLFVFFSFWFLLKANPCCFLFYGWRGAQGGSKQHWSRIGSHCIRFQN